MSSSGVGIFILALFFFCFRCCCCCFRKNKEEALVENGDTVDNKGNGSRGGSNEKVNHSYIISPWHSSYNMDASRYRIGITETILGLDWLLFRIFWRNSMHEPVKITSRFLWGFQLQRKSCKIIPTSGAFSGLKTFRIGKRRTRGGTKSWEASV